MQKLSRWQRIKSILFHLFPHHWVSRTTFFLSRINSYLSIYPIKWFIRSFNVDMSEAKEESPLAYSSFNAFFIRALKSDARPICEEENSIASPCDGTILQVGDCEEGQLIQAKGQHYTVNRLLGLGKHHSINKTKFCTIYLSPSDYHRVHMPLDGKLEDMSHIPGRLFSVAPYATESIENLYTKNERMVCTFNTTFGKMTLVLVGAINVAAIETVWSGLVSPRTESIARFNYQSLPTVELDKGEECARFNIGSTVILLFENDQVKWNPLYYAGEKIKMGQEIASV